MLLTLLRSPVTGAALAGALAPLRLALTASLTAVGPAGALVGDLRPLALTLTGALTAPGHATLAGALQPMALVVQGQLTVQTVPALAGALTFRLTLTGTLPSTAAAYARVLPVLELRVDSAPEFLVEMPPEHASV